ncbi:hypothetical protein CBL_05499 [Carabus blaptoides fortunei]
MCTGYMYICSGETDRDSTNPDPRKQHSWTVSRCIYTSILWCRWRDPGVIDDNECIETKQRCSRSLDMCQTFSIPRSVHRCNKCCEGGRDDVGAHVQRDLNENQDFRFMRNCTLYLIQQRKPVPSYLAKQISLPKDTDRPASTLICCI